MRRFNVIEAKKRVLAARLDAGLTQEDLGGRFKMSRSGFSSAENPANEKVFFTHEQILNLKYELGLSYDFIYEGITEGTTIKLTPSGKEGENTKLLLLTVENESLKDKVKLQEEFINSLKKQIELLTKDQEGK